MQGDLIRTGHFEADGNAVNLELGFTPSYFKIYNATNFGTENEIVAVEWWGETNKEIQHKAQKNDGGGDAYDLNYETSSGIISAYAGSSTASKGVTIAASFMADSDECYYVAVKSERDVDHGDINA